MALPATPAAPAISAATNGDETRLYLDVGAGFVEIGELSPEDGLTDLPAREQETYEVTHMKTGPYKAFKKMKRGEGAETDITGNFAIGSTSDTALVAAEASLVPVAYLIQLVQGDTTYNATGYALFYNLKRSNPGGAVRQFTITAKWQTPLNLVAA